MTAAALLRAACEAQVTVRLEDGVLRLAAPREPPAELLARLREGKAGIAALLAGDACRTCGARLAWPGPVGVVFADGTAECQRCADDQRERRLAGRQAVEGASAPADRAGPMLQPGCRPP